MAPITRHDDLLIFQRAIDAAVLVFYACKSLPRSERFELQSQWLRSSRSVPANVAEMWRKRYYRPHFLSKLTDIEAEAAESQVWALLSYRFEYISEATYTELYNAFDEVLRLAVAMGKEADRWTMRKR
jgi:four helix bundle protein